MEFEPINTQEEFDKKIKERIKRETDKFSDYDDLKKQVGELNDKIENLNSELSGKDTKYGELEKKYTESESKNAKYESDSVKTRIALESGLPYGMIERVNGSTEEEIKADIEKLLSFTSSQTITQPMFTGNEGDSSSIDSALKQMANSLTKG